MCGRFVITSTPDALRKLFGYTEIPNMPARYNIAPTQPVPVVVQEHGARHFHLMRWGLLPAWVKDPRSFPLVINARSETVREKPAFRNALKRRRSLLPADGYFEWQEQAGRKQPFFISRRDRSPIAFAGLAETWIGPNGEEMDTVAIVTTAATTEMIPLHHRVPVTVELADFERWLDGAAFDVEAASVLLRPPLPGTFVWHAVSTAVNRVANDGPELIQPMTPEQSAAEDAAIAAKRPLPKKRRPTRAPGDDSGQGSLF